MRDESHPQLLIEAYKQRFIAGYSVSISQRDDFLNDYVKLMDQVMETINNQPDYYALRPAFNSWKKAYINDPKGFGKGSRFVDLCTEAGNILKELSYTKEAVDKTLNWMRDKIEGDNRSSRFKPVSRFEVNRAVKSLRSFIDK